MVSLEPLPAYTVEQDRVLPGRWLLHEASA
jgi:hypothetical protein